MSFPELCFTVIQALNVKKSRRKLRISAVSSNQTNSPIQQSSPREISFTLQTSPQSEWSSEMT